MSNTIIFEPGGDRSRLGEVYCPSVRFQIPSELHGLEYVGWLDAIFIKFIISLSDHPMNRRAAESFYFGGVNQESGIGGVYIGNEYFRSCKLFAHDGEERAIMEDWKGIWMRNHLDETYTVPSLYLLAEKFEEFLRNNCIPYQRFGRKIGKSDELGQLTKF